MSETGTVISIQHALGFGYSGEIVISIYRLILFGSRIAESECIYIYGLFYLAKIVLKFTIENLDYLALMANTVCDSMYDNDRENSLVFHILVNSGCSSG